MPGEVFSCVNQHGSPSPNFLRAAACGPRSGRPTAGLKKRVEGVGAAGPGDQRPEEQRTRDQRTRDQRPEDQADQVDQGPRPTLPSCKYKNTAFALFFSEAIVGRDQGTKGKKPRAPCRRTHTHRRKHERTQKKKKNCFVRQHSELPAPGQRHRP